MVPSAPSRIKPPVHRAGANFPSPVISYKNQAHELLKYIFPRLSVGTIGLTFASNKWEFAPTHRALRNIADVVDNWIDVTEEGIQNRRALILVYASFLGPTKAIVLKSKRSCKNPTISNQKLLNELAEIPEMSAKGNCKRKAYLITEAAEEHMDPHSNRGGGRIPTFETPAKTILAAVARLPLPHQSPAPMEAEVECECCFGDYPFEGMAQCDSGAHLFCQTCVRDYVREQLFGQDRNDFHCMSSDGCKSRFSKTVLAQALSPRLLKKVDEHTFRTEVSGAKMDDLWSCPECAHLVVVPEAMMFVTCPNEACKHSSCKNCKERPHKNQTCAQAKSEAEKGDAHSRMADAMAAAVMRSCPGCQTKMIKSTGCNKMVCPVKRCQTKFCYLCRQQIEDYSHFCRTPHCTHEACGKCILFTDDEAMDRIARREAGQKEQQAIGKAAEDIGFLSPPAKPKARKRARRVRAQAQVQAQARPAVPAQAHVPRIVAPPAQELRFAVVNHFLLLAFVYLVVRFFKSLAF